MTAGRASGIRRLMAGLAAAVLVLSVAPGQLEAQLVDKTDPCFVTLFGAGTSNVFTYGSWSSLESLETAAVAIQGLAGLMLASTKAAQQQVNAGTITPADLERLRARNRCLPWLNQLLGRIEATMRDLGGQTIASPEDRRRMERDQFMKELRAELAETQRLLTAILRGR